MHGVQRFAVGVEQRGRKTQERVSTTEVLQANGDSGIGAPAQKGLLMKVGIPIISITPSPCRLVYIDVAYASAV